MPRRRALVAGNWKMHGLKASVAQLEAVLRGSARVRADVDLMVCPPATLIAAFAAAATGSRVAIGGQDCHAEPSGAYTGDISAEMLADAGARAVIGGQTLAVVERQLAGSVPDRAGPDNLVIAYEPVWAIGTGLTPTAADIEAVHGMIRKRLARRFAASGEGIRVLYGGSVKPENARELLAVGGVDGALVGGASLKAEDFLAIAAAYACRRQ